MLEHKLACFLLDGFSSADPNAGRIGGFCSRSSPCADKEHSQCNTITSTCACKAGFVLEEKDFSCSKYYTLEGSALKNWQQGRLGGAFDCHS